jgi:D-arabinose 1-dehydrogenase-like Zn-dependent alcohol dehydrogenase
VVPGHEIVGRVTAVGTEVTRHRQGDLVGVGCMVDSCQDCAGCADGLEQYCLNGFTGTYAASRSRRGRPPRAAIPTGSWWTSVSCSASRGHGPRPPPLLCCARDHHLFAP